MGRVSIMVAAIGALAMASAAGSAMAQPRPKGKSRAETVAPAFTADPTGWNQTPAQKTLQWQADRRWGLKLDVDKPTTRDVQWRDVEAGAYYRLTPSISVGGSVGLGTQDEEEARRQRITADEKPQPRVRLETTFRF